ncbi:gamma-tubulin complex component 6 [Calliopsis andreniformis]|uniref:gamma-tubulin complex component 6 n=1 Tax=Calliopsis andreniformis TaxID=337506 RepID=UPI003FCEB417
MNANNDADIYGLITELSKHILERYRPPHQNTQFTYDYDYDNKRVKRLRTRAFEILLKKTDVSARSQDGTELEKRDPIVELQKYVFMLRVGLRRSYDADTLEQLLQDLQDSSSLETSVCSVLQLLIQLKDLSVSPEPITNIFYYGKPNSALPEISYSNKVPMYQMYPMECFILSDKLEATLEPQRFQITHATPVAVMNELPLLYGAIKSTSAIGIESMGMLDAPSFMSSHAFDTVSMQALTSPNLHFTSTSILDTHIPQEIVTYGDEDEDKIEHVFPRDKEPAITSYTNLPSTHTETIIIENESVTDNTWKSSNHSVINELNYSTSTWNHIWDQVDITTETAIEYRTWEYFGEMQAVKESLFMTDLPAAIVHLAKIRQTSSLSLLPEKIMNSVQLLEEISIEQFATNMRSMLLGIESDTFAYIHTTGFTLRKNINVHGVCSETLEETCQEAINWGNCFKFLSHFVTPNIQNGKQIQEGLIFKAMCTSIKELLLYYQAALQKIFSRKNKTEGILQTFLKVRPVAVLIIKVAEFCKPYKENQYALKEGNGILTRIYNEAIKVTDNRVALVFYSLLKSCCEVYFQFLQKWMFEGICDDIYGEFMIKTRSQYLRNRGHKFWTKSFTVCNEAIPGFLSDLTESILQCGKTVRLLRICDSKNPVCHISITEQPEVKVCLSVTALHEQSSRCREYEEKGKFALGPIFSLATAISNRKQLEKEMAEFVIRGQRNTLLRIRAEREDALKKAAQTKRDLLASLKEQSLMHQRRKESEASNKIFRQNEDDKRENAMQENLLHIERTSIINYYETLMNDVDKRCIRSQWRVKRMTFYDKRVHALTTTEQNPRIETPAAFEDENKNYARMSCQALNETTSDTRILPTEISQRNMTQSHERETISNDNKESDFRDFLNNQRLEELSEKMFSKFSQDKNTITIAVSNVDQSCITPSTNESNNILQNIPTYKHRTSTIERPTSLNVSKLDNMTTTLQVNMTPNNNEPDVQVKITPNANELVRSVVSSEENTINLNQDNDLETPMSLFTDNFTSSIQTPNSQAHNSEVLTEISTSDLSNSPYTYMKSPIGIKEELTFPELFVTARAEPVFSTSVTAAPLTVTDVEILDHTSLQAYLEKSIRIPLNIQRHLVNNAVIKYFLEENNLLLHLHSLRSYFFLLNGEFAKSLTDSLYARLYEISKPIELFNSATLTNLLKRALINSFNNVYINSELLSLSATDTPAELYISDPNALDCLSLNYKISWPLNIILDETVMQQYGKVFKFLITSGRVSWVLQEDFNILKRKRKVATSEQYHKLQLYRHAMTQFMNALHNYLTCSVLYASWTEFEKDLGNSVTVDQIYLSHVNYVKRILSRCMLNTRGEKVRICLNNIFKVILKFHNRLRSQNWIVKSTGYVHPNFKKLEQMYGAFCELRTYMAHIAYKLATSGYQPHLMHFLNSLNINHLYNLTTKNHGSSSQQ